MDESVVKHLEQQEVGTLKLSAAIRIGARLRPQALRRSAYFDNCGSCALGAAYEAITGKTGIDHLNYMVLTRALKKACGVKTSDLMDVCMMFYDGLSREEIADRLEAQGY